MGNELDFTPAAKDIDAAPVSQPAHNPLEGAAAQKVIRDQQLDHRLAGGESVHSFHEKVMGSISSVEQVHLPMNVDSSGGQAECEATVEGNGFSVDLPRFILRSSFGALSTPVTAQSVGVRFAPTHVGETHGTLVLTARWPDGKIERRDVLLFGYARFIDDAPRDFVLHDEKPRKSDASGEAPVLVPDGADLLRFNDAKDDFNIEMTKYLGSQRQGVENVEKEAGKFVEGEPPESILTGLVELAIVMGTAGGAAVLGKMIGKQVEHAIGDLFLKKGKDRVEEGFASAAEDGLKDAAAKALAKVRGGKKKSEPDAPSEEESSTGSSDETIGFFSRQYQAINDIAADHGHGLVRAHAMLRNVLAKDAPLALAQLRAATRGVVDAQEHVLKIQGAATAKEWISFVAQKENGAVAVNTNRGEINATKMNVLRGEGGQWSSLGDGVLQLDVGTADGGVAAARLNGVGRAVAERLINEDLNRTRIPIIFRSTFRAISRDEAGRIRLSEVGDRNTAHDVQRVEEGEAIVKTALRARV